MFLADTTIRRRIHRVKTFAMSFSNHFGKAARLAMSKKDWAGYQAQGRAALAQNKRIAYEKLKGPTPEAQALRTKYKARVRQKCGEMSQEELDALGTS